MLLNGIGLSIRKDPRLQLHVMVWSRKRGLVVAVPKAKLGLALPARQAPKVTRALWEPLKLSSLQSFNLKSSVPEGSESVAIDVK